MNFIDFHKLEIQRLLSVWRALGPPLRPSPEDVEAFSQNWKAGEGLRVLILGVTPELVDLAVRKKSSRVIAMDCSRPAFTAMRIFGRENWDRVEALPNEWQIFLPDLEGTLDMVLGDGSLTMLAFPAEWEQILKNTHRYLGPGGRMILRLPFQPEEPFNLEMYMKETFSRFDHECAGAGDDQRLKLFRNLISEMRIAFGVASAGRNGVVDLNRRAEFVRRFHTEFAARYGHWKEWETVRIGMPPESEVRYSGKTGKAVPSWPAAVGLFERHGFAVAGVKESGIRPAPGAMRFFIAERI
jgi:SAM-dependent methyltransferase